MPNPLTVGRRATVRLEEAILLALEEHRDQGYLNTLRLAERIGWDNDGMPPPNGQGYGRIAVIGLLYRLYLAGKVEPGPPAQPPRPLGRLAHQRRGVRPAQWPGRGERLSPGADS